MSIKDLIFKPRWQSKDPAVRAAAVATETDPELLRALPSILLEDPVPEVRAAAIRRIDDLKALLLAAQRTADTVDQDLISERLRVLTGSRGEDRPPLEDRLAVIEASSDRELLETVVRHAPESELRRAALPRVKRQGVLGDVAIGDPDPEIRRLAADRVTQRSSLERICAAVRKSDKALYQELSARLHRQRLANGEAEAVAVEALAICTQLETLAAQPAPPDNAELMRLDRAWSEIRGHVIAAHRERHAAALVRLREPPRTSATTPPPPSREPAAVAEPPEAPAVAEPPKAPAEAATESRPAAVAPAPVEDHGTLLTDLEVRVAELRQLVEAGELHRAFETRNEILARGKGLGRNRRWLDVQQEVRQLHARLRELRDWLHWSNNKKRKLLIREMRALPGSGLHPDAVLQKLKELQTQWKELERSEQIPGERHFSAPSSLWRKFNQAGREAFELTKPFLDRRSEIQAKHLDEMRTLRKELASLAAAPEIDWAALRKARSSAGRSLRRLGEVPARSRKQMASELKQAMAVADQRLGEREAEVEKVKRKLIRAAAQLAHLDDRPEAIAQAKALQAEWQAAGTLRRGLEQKLWKAFREPIDPLFDLVTAEREAEREEQAQALQAQKDLCAGLRAVLDSDDRELAGLRGKVLGLEESWQQVSHPVRRLRQEFRDLVGEFDRRIEQHERAQAQATRDRWWVKADLLHDLESSLAQGKPHEEAAAAWPRSGKDEDATDQLLDSRRDALLEGHDAPTNAATPEVLEQGRMLCIRLEFLAGLPSPEEDRDLRMRYQVDRLSASMAGTAERLPARQEARLAEQEWLRLAFIPDPVHAAYRARVRSALRALFKV